MRPAPNIAIFSGYYHSHGGGIEIVSGHLAEGLERRGYRVLWCALRDDRSLNGSRIVRCPLTGTDIVYRLTGTPMPLPAPHAFRQIWKTIETSNVVIIAEANFLSNAIAFAIAKLKRRPVLLVQHLGLPSTASRPARLLTQLSERLVVRPMLRAGNAVVYVSEAVRGYFRDVRTRSEPLIIGHGVDTTLFRIAGPCERSRDRREFALEKISRVACYVGRCTESKGVLVLREMARRRPDWTFVIAGSGPIDPAEWNLSNVRNLGHVDPARVASLYRSSDLLVLPSPYESFSLVVREALACGIGVLCGDSIVQTDPNLERFVRAIRVDLADAEGTALRFVEALDAAAANPPGAAAYVAGQCSWDSVVSAYSDVVEKLIEGAERSRLVAA